MAASRLTDGKLWALVLVVALVAVGGLLGFRWFSGRVFASRLSDFEVKFVRSGMPGKPVVTTVLNSDGVLTREQRLNDVIQSTTSSTLSPKLVQQVRLAVSGLHGMKGDYRPPFWDKTSDRQYLWIVITPRDGSTKEIFLDSVNPPAVQRLIDLINSEVDDQLKIRFPKR